MVVTIEVDIDKLLMTFASESGRLLEQAEQAHEGGKEYYELCFRLCSHLQFVRMTCTNNAIPMPKWYERDLDNLRIMYPWHRDVNNKGKPKYRLFTW